ncbi:hypothetical protein HanRHA438_Chr13g0577211 [Helianthus annuus]|nr:hypothetical protein HanHA300_Chr13g0463871 [Helianthus annuus]KAJ0479081.1 hypothetical protein HanIR_Chr13g0616041 [Helianthus annuus]KAJ0856322.1 hypothetical protein HanRHA438_Chr13g0577211 [Helianthus annuus]
MAHCGHFHVQMAPKAPKEGKRKKAIKKENKTEEEIMSEKRHNQVAYMDPDDKLTEFKDITKWIRESRINYTITFSTPVYKSLIKAFWDSASVVQIDGKDIIRGRVNDLYVVITSEILNEVLQLQDSPDAPYSIPIMCSRGCLLRMKCKGDIFVKQINKGDLPLRYKFLLHILVQCLSNRRSGYDMAGDDLVGFMVALVLNKPFSISKYIFSNMKENMTRTGSRTTGNKFWMYPRFLQMVMNVQHPDLPKADNDILKIEAMNFNSLRLIKNLAAKRYKESVPPRKLIGALANPDYVAPANDKWRHDDSQSDSEEPELERLRIEKFGPDPVDSDESGSDSDGSSGESDNGGDTGAVGTSSKGAAGGTSASSSSASGDDESDSSSSDHIVEPGYEMYIDIRGVRRYRKIRTEDDPAYVPEDPESERRTKRRAEKAVEIQKKKSRRYLSTYTRKYVPQESSSVPQEPVQSVPQEPVQETPTVVTSTAETPVVTSAAEIPAVTPQAAPQRTMASAIRATTSQISAERHRTFSGFSEDEKIKYLFSTLEAAADRVQRQSHFINLTKHDQLKQSVEINNLKSTVGQQQTMIERQQAEIELLKAENARLKAVDEEKERRMAVLWDYHCKQQEILKKKDDDTEDQGNPDTSGTSQKQPAVTSSEIVEVQPPVVESSQGTSTGKVQQIAGTSSVVSSADIALQAVHPFTGELLEEGELIEDLSQEQLTVLQSMRKIDDAEIDKMSTETDTTNVEDIDEIVFEGEATRSTYVRNDGTELASFDKDWMKENIDDIDEHLRNRNASEKATDAFSEWRKQFLSKVSKPVPEKAQVDYLQFEKAKPSGRILCWMFVRDIHCVAIKREYGILYFNSLLSILSLPFYDVAALTRIKLINRSNYDGATLFERLIKVNKKSGWEDESYKPQFPIYQPIKFTLDPDTNTCRYKLVYQPPRVVDKIPLMPMQQDFLEDMALWCYDSDTDEAVIVFRDGRAN